MAAALGTEQNLLSFIACLTANCELGQQPRISSCLMMNVWSENTENYAAKHINLILYSYWMHISN